MRSGRMEINDETYYNDATIALAINSNARTYLMAAYDAGTNRMLLTRAGVLTLQNLAGTGTRVQTVSSTGVLGSLTNATDGQILTLVSGAPAWANAAGGISGLTAGRVPFASDATTIVDDADLTFSGNTLTGTNIYANNRLYGNSLEINNTTFYNEATVAMLVNSTSHTYLFNMYDAGTARLLLTRAGDLTINTGTLTMPGLGTTGNRLVGRNSSSVLYETSLDPANIATIASPTFTGVPAGPTAAGGTNTTQIATTAFVQTEIASNVSKGTYTPTITGVDNVESSTGYDLNWTRIGDMVHVFGQVEINVTSASTITRFRASLPAASSFANTTIGGGVISSPHGVSGSVKPNAASGELLFEFLCGTDVDNRVFHFTVSYKTTAP